MIENILYGKLKEWLVHVFAQFKYNSHEKSAVAVHCFETDHIILNYWKKLL